MNRKPIPFVTILVLLVVGLAACGSTQPLATTTADSPLAAPEPGLASGPTPAGKTASPAATSSDAQACLDHTPGDPECKDCCDGLDADGATRKACRDACATHDFSHNTDFITVSAPSILGPAGDYSLCTAAGDTDPAASTGEQACKACCDGSADLQAGDRRFCRDACAAESGSTPPGGSAAPVGKPGAQEPPPNAPGSGPQALQQSQKAMNIEQAISDEAQRNTIAFDALAFLTGNLGADSFFPPGKVADFWGFQYLRDNDPSQMGHNTDFLTRAALNMLSVLTPEQRAELVALAEGQVDAINEYGYNRFVLIDAFRRLLAGDLPAGSTGLNEDAVKAYSADLYRLDGQISYDRAQVMGTMLSALDTAQRAYLDAMVGKGMLDWPDVDEPAGLKDLDRDTKVAVMTYAGDMFSWYAGSVEADVYFCPERQGTYFGSFYLKDAQAMGNPDYTISSSLTGDMGRALLETLNPDQSQLVTGLVDSQKPALGEIVDRREDVAALLRQFLTGATPDRAAVLGLMERYGELDGEIVYLYATAFAQVDQTLTADQRAQLMTLRTEILGDLLYPSGAYLYSQPIPLPDIPNTDFLFTVP